MVVAGDPAFGSIAELIDDRVRKEGSLSYLQTVILGGIAGLTIFLGLPVARLRVGSDKHLALLNAFAIGILFFLFVEIMEHAFEPVEEALEGQESGFLPLLLVLGAGFGAGLLGLVYYSRRFLRGEISARRLALLIAEKNERKVNLGLLALCGLIGGGPTLLGTLVGFSYTSELLSVLFLALAGGAVVFVVNELLGGGRKLGAPAWGGWGKNPGFFAGLFTGPIPALPAFGLLRSSPTFSFLPVFDFVPRHPPNPPRRGCWGCCGGDGLMSLFPQ